MTSEQFVYHPAILTPAIILAVAGIGLVAFMIYVWIRYSPIIGRIFEETPVFLPLRVTPEPGGEEVRFTTPDGLTLEGTYYAARTPQRAGVVVFCHEFLGDRWSFQPYTDELRDLGFDLFTFDFRNHGTSAVDSRYKPLQWVSDLELVDLRAAIDHLRSRPDRDPAGVGLFGISRGGGAALCVAAQDPSIWGVVTDGAFPTRGTMLAYILRWAEIYVGSETLWRRMPIWMFAFAGWAGRMSSQARLGRQYPDMERAVGRLAPRPWLMIHGEKDAYIRPEIAEELFVRAREPKDLWIVPGAKHNRCRELEPDVYRLRIVDFFRRYAPRRPAVAVGRPIAQTEADGALATNRRESEVVAAAVNDLASGVSG
jgi:pimeloyl-ACP methyl ester carboxylesterase